MLLSTPYWIQMKGSKMNTTTRSAGRSTTFGPLQYGIIALTVITALIHLFRAMNAQGTFQTLFYLNFLGYVVLLVALYLPQLIQWRSLIRWALIAFTAITILAYFYFAGLRPNPVGLIDKLVEVVLIVLLFMEGRSSRV